MVNLLQWVGATRTSAAIVADLKSVRGRAAKQKWKIVSKPDISSAHWIVPKHQNTMVVVAGHTS